MSEKQKTAFILVPDGVSLKNFAYTNFYCEAQERGFNVVFWHQTPFDFDFLGFEHLKLERPKLHWFTTILKNVRKRVEISRFAKRENDDIYYRYLFPLTYKNLKSSIKSVLTRFLSFCFNSERGLKFIKSAINILESRTSYNKYCFNTLKEHQPDIVYCVSQRNALAIAPLLAATKLEIPTVSFIYSWDNLPKATLDVSADYYHVWSNHMKNELLFYYPFINDSQVKVTGTPQFEPHYDSHKLESKVEFFGDYGLDMNVRYLCYSGDDVTTSPKDPLYLRDVAAAIRTLNKQGHSLGLIFRRCPVDFSDRYDSILTDYKDVIVPIQPIWKKMGGAWDTILPMPQDVSLLSNLALHTAAVINLGSSMVFDYAIHQKPCLYINYNYFNPQNNPEKGVYVYDYVHFRSRPSDEVVIWLNHPDDIASSLLRVLDNPQANVAAANAWYEKINEHPANLASIRIWNSIETILKKEQD